MKTKMVTVVRPDFDWGTRNAPRYPKLTDYIQVPRLSTIGTFRIVDLLPMETLAGLSHLRDDLNGVVRRKNAR